MSEYTIVNRKRWTFLDEYSNPVDGYRFSFRMEDGTLDWVDIKESDLSKENVDAAIEAKMVLHREFMG